VHHHYRCLGTQEIARQIVAKGADYTFVSQSKPSQLMRWVKAVNSDIMSAIIPETLSFSTCQLAGNRQQNGE